MIIVALGALYAFVTSISVALSANLETQQVEWWRVFGFLFFSVLFLLLGLRPRSYPGIWELVILDKLILTVTEYILAVHNATNAYSAMGADAILVVFILISYFLSKGYLNWYRPN